MFNGNGTEMKFAHKIKTKWTSMDRDSVKCVEIEERGWRMAIYTLSVHLEISTLADCRPVHLSCANVQSSSCKITNNSTGYTENGAEAVGYILHMYLCNWKLNRNLYKVNFANWIEYIQKDTHPCKRKCTCTACTLSQHLMNATE